jgi:type I restriction enzyme R subunit
VKATTRQAFVRDTLRFFEVDRPPSPTASRTPSPTAGWCRTRSTRPKTVKTAAEGGFEVKKTSSTGRPWMPYTATEFDRAVRRQQHDHRRSQRPGAPLHHPRAQPRHRARVPPGNEKGYLDRKACSANRFGKTIVFAVTKRHAETLAACSTKFADEKPSPCATPTTWSPARRGRHRDGMTKIKRFKKEPFPQILVSVNMLDTGFDCPEVVNLVFARFTAPPSSTSRCAAGARASPPTSPLHHVRFRRRHRLPRRRRRDWSRAASSWSRPRRTDTSPAACWPWTSTTTSTRPPANGSRWTRTATWSSPASEQKAAELGARFEAWLLARESGFDAEQRRWLRLLGSQIRANADTLDDLLPEHFAFFHTFTARWVASTRRAGYSAAAGTGESAGIHAAAVFSGEESTSGRRRQPSAPNRGTRIKEPHALTPDLRRKVDQIRELPVRRWLPRPGQQRRAALLPVLLLPGGRHRRRKRPQGPVLKQPYTSRCSPVSGC